MSNQGSALIDAVNAAYPAMSQLYASDWYVLEAANEGYYVGAGCAVTASGTAGKVDLSLGITLQGGVEVNVAAVTAATTTITSLADATNPKWVALEIDSAGALQFNAGTAAANPEKPTPTSARVMVAWLYVPANATAVDALTSSANGKAKIIDARQLVPGVSATGWQYEQGTWLYGAGASSGVQAFAIAGDQTAVYRASTKLSWNDGTNTPGYGVVWLSGYGSTVTGISANVTTNQFTKTAHGYSNPAISAVQVSGLVNVTGGVVNGGVYWVNYVDANTVTLALTYAGAAIDITGANDGAVITFTPLTSALLIFQSDFYLRNATIVRPRYSYAATPQGFPAEFAYAPTLSGYSAAPTAARYTWTTTGAMILVTLAEGTNGTSNNATHTYSLPVTAKTVTNGIWTNPATCIDNATLKNGYWQVTSGAATVAINGLIAGGNTASAGSRVLTQVSYPFA